MFITDESLVEELYKETLLDHYKNPRNKKKLEKPDINSEGINPLCGDEITIELKIENDVIVDIGINPRGCAISTASASIMSELVKNKTIDEVKKNIELFKSFMHGKEINFEFEDLEVLRGIQKLPVRIKCALLSWTTLEEGLKKL